MNTNKFELKSQNELVVPDGRTVKIKPVSIARIRAAENKARTMLLEKGLILDPPMYVPTGVTLAPGAEAPAIPYNDETIVEASEEDKKKYGEYKVNKKILTQTTVGLMFTTLILRGTDIEIPENGWVEEQKADGMTVPTDKDELYVHYMTTEVLIPPAVAQECALRILYLSLEGVDPEVLRAFEDSFQRNVSDRGEPARNKGKTKEG
jgi:hypothetical protein